METKTTRSLASNLIDPTNYVHGGGVVNGKLGFENVPEDWIMYVQLYVRPKNRSVLLKNTDNKLIVSGENQEYLVADIPYYKQTVNKNLSGTIIPFDLQTTEYTDIFGAKGLMTNEAGTSSSLGQESAFGITSIKIDFNDVVRPSIEINFVDIRGVGLMSYGPTNATIKSPYSWFFLLPYPEFCLKVKGFYGKTISIPLQLHKFSVRYNSSTGNFDITANFVGYPFGVLNDINIKILERLCCIPGGLEELKNAYNKLVSCLDPANPDDKIILDELPRIDDLCIFDYIRAIEAGKINNPIQEKFSKASKTGEFLISKYKQLITELNAVLNLVRANGGDKKESLYSYFLSLLIKMRLVESNFQALYQTPSNEEEPNTKQYGLGGSSIDNDKKDSITPSGDNSKTIPIKNFSDYIKDKNLKEELFIPITLDTSKAYFDVCATNGDITAEQELRDGINKILSEHETDLTKLEKITQLHIPVKRFEAAMNSGGVINAVEKALLMLREQLQERIELLENYQVFICNYFQTIEKEFKKEFTEELKVRPTVQRIMTLIALNVEAFLSLLLKVSIEAEKYHEKHKTSAVYTAYYTDSSNQAFKNLKGNANNKSASLRNIKLYPWPETYTFNGEGKKVECFPTDLHEEFGKWPEVIFTKNVISALLSNNCYHSQIISVSTGGISRWKPLNIFEDAPFAINKPLNSVTELDSPYNNDLLNQYISTPNESDNVGDNERENKLKQIIVSRAIFNLFYLNHLFEQDGDDISSTNKIIYDNYVVQLAQRDADILRTTLTQCNLIELLSNRFSSDAGVTLLKNYIQSPELLNFSKTLTYIAPDQLQIPYGMLFLTGNNNTKIKVVNNGKTYLRRRSTNESLNDILTNNFYGLSYFDKPQYPFKRYVTIYLNTSGSSIINGFEYDNEYKRKVLNVGIDQDVIYSYNPWYQPSSVNQITPPLGIPSTTIANPEIPRNIFYNVADVVNYVTYEPFLNPSHIRDVRVFDFTDLSKLPLEQTLTIDPINPASSKFETGNGIPSWRPLFNLLEPVVLNNNNVANNFPIGIKGFDSYKIISPNSNVQDAIIENTYHPINRFDNKTYYYGIDPLLKVLSNTIRVYHTTYNHYLSDTFKSFLWDPYKTKIGNTSINKLGSQEKSVYTIVTNLDNEEVKQFTLTDKTNQILVFTPSESIPLTSEWRAGSYWGEPENSDKINVGFQNAIFFSSNKDIEHFGINQKLPVFTHLHDEQSHRPSLLQYLFVGDKGGNVNTTIPYNSRWLKDFGEDGDLGIDYNGETFTMKQMFNNTSPFNDPKKYFFDYAKLINDPTKGLSTHSFYDIPTNMNSTWFIAKMREFGKAITPVKKYQTTYMKKLSYLIWKEATMRILSMCEINLNTGKEGITNGQYFIDNYTEYAKVYIVDDPAKRLGGPTTSTATRLFDDTYPQSKFYNPNIDKYNGDTKYQFYDKFIDDNTGTYIIGTSSLETFNGLNTPGPIASNAFYPNDNPTDNFVAGAPLTFTQPPLLTLPPSGYTGTVTTYPLWSRLYIHQTKWWKDMTSDPRLTVDDSIDERRIMKTYLTLMALWGANSMDALVYNYPLMSPASGLFRVNNLDLLTLGAFLWASESKLKNGVDYVRDVINSHLSFTCGIPNNPSLVLNFGNPQISFPFNVVFKDTMFNIKTFNRWYDYGCICEPGYSDNGFKRGSTIFNLGTDISNPNQKWEVQWKLGNNPKIYTITPSNLSEDVKRDLINNFLMFVETSEFSRNIDDNLDALVILRELAEVALGLVENNIQNGEKAYHLFPFDIEQTLLMWADWASIVDLNDTTKKFKSYYDADDNWRVKRPEQKVVLSSKLFDMLTIESSDGTLDHPFKEIKTYVINGKTFYYSPWVRVDDNRLFMFEGDVGRKILLKLLKVITYEEQMDSEIPIITKREGKYETILNYKQRGLGKTLSGNDKNYFFDKLFKGFYFPTVYGGMRTTSLVEYDNNSLGGYKLYLTKSWREAIIPGVSDSETIRKIIQTIPKSDKLEKYFTAFCNEISKIKNNNENYEKCKNQNNSGKQNYLIDVGSDSLIWYRTFRILFNRWLAGSTEDDNTYKRSGCNNILGGKCKTLIKNIFIVDRVNRPAGHLVCVNAEFIAKFFNNNPNATVMTFISDLISKPEGGVGGFVFEYPTFFNFGNYGINLEDDPGKAMWGMTTIVDEKWAGPALVIYVQRPDTGAVNTELNKFVNEEVGAFNLNEDLPDDFKLQDSRGVIFKVDVTNENNNIFTNLQIDTQSYKETWEHIVALDQISKEIANASPHFLNQNLYNLWNVVSWTASLECFGNMMIQQGMYFKLENIPIFGGVYLIKKVSHTIEPHNIKTTFWGSRISQIPQPYVNNNAIDGYYNCTDYSIEKVRNTINNDPGYCKTTMLEILDAFVQEVKKVLGVEPLVYTSDEFLSAIGFTEDDSKTFYNKYRLMVRKDNQSNSFANVDIVSVKPKSFFAGTNVFNGFSKMSLTSNMLIDEYVSANISIEQLNFNPANFLGYIPPQDRDAFLNKVKEVARDIKTSPEALLLVMACESRINPYAQYGNPTRQKNTTYDPNKATGLIQFTPETLQYLGTSVGVVANMDAIPQMELVRRYFKKGLKAYPTFYDLYLYTAYPAAVGKPDDWVWGLEKSYERAKYIADHNPAIAQYSLRSDRLIDVNCFKRYINAKLRQFGVL